MKGTFDLRFRGKVRLGFRGSGFRVSGLGFRIPGLELRACGLGSGPPVLNPDFVIDRESPTPLN